MSIIPKYKKEVHDMDVKIKARPFPTLSLTSYWYKAACLKIYSKKKAESDIKFRPIHSPYRFPPGTLLYTITIVDKYSNGVCKA